ncbi:hypothetical protein BGZ60DRAFT_381354 [Tricladium varicosporioides]|nr:hypothetical protein BGZ60DRAFT_381354 [Hymenoscyphus varicosporioides]
MFYNLLIQAALMVVAMAAPLPGDVSIESSNTWQYGTGGGVLGFIVLILDILVFMEVLKSNRPVTHKVLWCLVVFLFPVLGLVVYWLFSNREAHRGSGGYETIA